METITETAMFDDELQSLYRLLNGNLLLSQERCVDALLDLYNAAPTALIRDLIGDMLSDIRFVSAVRTQLLRDDLTLLTSYR